MVLVPFTSLPCPSLPSPSFQVEATKFTELGFVGRDVDEIVKDLMEASLTLTRTRLADALREVADQAAEDIILKSLTGSETEDGIGRFRCAGGWAHSNSSSARELHGWCTKGQERAQSQATCGHIQQSGCMGGCSQHRHATHGRV